MQKSVRIPPSPALEEMYRRDAEAGIDVLGDAPPPPGPAERAEPLVPVSIPAPSWRVEEEDRLRREADDEKRANSYPAKPTKKTPRLDAAKELQAEARAISKGAP